MKKTKGAWPLHRSDGTVKIYGYTTDGKTMTIVMTPRANGSGYEIEEIKVAGKIVKS